MTRAAGLTNLYPLKEGASQAVIPFPQNRGISLKAATLASPNQKGFT